LTYTSVEIRPSGIILHGSLAVTDPQPVATLGIGAPGALAAAGWPPPYVEFEQIPTRDGGGVAGIVTALTRGPDYSALKSWIPGGTIEQYEWSLPGQAQPSIDNHTFVLLPAPFVVSDGTPSATPSPPQQPTVSSGYTPLCLTVRGSRYSSSGPVVKQPVSASVCGYSTFPTIPAGLMSRLKGSVPLVALTQPGPRGLLQVVGHTPGRLDQAEGDPPNLIVHFADERTAGHLELLTQALRDSRREDAATAVLAVLTPDQFAKTRHVEGVIYAEEQGGAWARVFAVTMTRTPVTLIAGPKGNVVWQHEGDLDSTTLTAALRRVLVKGGFIRPRMLRLNLRLGRPAPNFLFELAPGHQLTLRKLAGRAIILAFWTSASKPSLEVVRDLQKPTGTAGGQGPVVLAINDGDAVELARRVAAENRLSAILVTDPKRTISLAYGVNIWPTIVFIDASGVVTQIRYGRHEHRGVDSSRVIAPTVPG
jgi:peroxiredoxin